MEATVPIGYLGKKGTLYCSRACAASRGEAGAIEVDEQEYDALAESGRFSGDAVCPVCGSGFTVVWPDAE